MVTVLRAHALSFSWGLSRVFAGVSLQLAAGTVTAILGANGCGKTTLLGCLSGLLHPQDGEVELARGDALRRIHALSVPERARAIAVVPQSIGTSFGYTALEIVLMGRTAGIGMFAVPTRDDEEAAYLELERIGIPHLAHRRLDRMSGGELRLVLIARALATQASVLLLDEPTAHLDFRNQLVVQNLLGELAAERNVAIGLTTHLPTDAFSAGSYALLMYRDNRHAFGPIDEVLTDESIRDAFSVDARIVSLRVNGSKSHVVVPLEPVPTKEFS